MSTACHTIDWNGLRERMSRMRTQVQDSGKVSQERLREVFHERASRLARRAQAKQNHATNVPVFVFRIAAERFGIELRHVKQVYPRVPITPLPGMSGMLLGVANLSGSLRSVIDLSTLLGMPAAKPEAGYVILVRARDKSLGFWVETIEGVTPIDLNALIPVREVVAEHSADYLRETTEDRIVVITVESLLDRLRDNVQLHGSNQGGIGS